MRKHGIIPERPPSPSAIFEQALVDAQEQVEKTRLERADLDELDELEDEEDEEMLARYREIRRQEIIRRQRSRHGTVYPISKPDYEREVTEASATEPVFVHLAASTASNVESSLLSNIWRDAAREYPELKFCQIRADQAIENYPDRNCPTILVYKAGEIAKQVVTLRTLGGTSTSLRQIDDLIVDVGALADTDSRIMKRRRDFVEARHGQMNARSVWSGRRLAGSDDEDDYN